MRFPVLRLAIYAFALSLGGRAYSQTFSLYQLKTANHEVLDKIAEKYEIVGREGDSFKIYVPIAAAKSFESTVPEAELLSKDVDVQWRSHWNKGLRFASGYHDFNAVQTFMRTAVDTYPDRVSLHSYGESKNGYQLNYLKLSNGSQKAKPKIFLDAATHGDELISTEVLLSLVNEILKGYGTDDRLTAMLENTDIYVSFVVNPDGFVKQQRYEGLFVDPNRSYPWPGDPSKKPTPSIQALMDLFEQERFEGSMTFHAYSKLLMYPWGYSSTPIADAGEREEFDALTTKLAATNGYTHGSIADTIYVAQGSSADYYYWKYKTKALAVELTTSKVPPPAKIPQVVDEAREMVWQFIENFYNPS